MALTKLITDLIDGDLGGGTTWVSDPKTANFTAVVGKGYFVDTTSSAITVTLPSSPTAGDEISLIDYGANASTNNITITSSDNIEGATEDVLIDYNKGSVNIVYSDATKGWIVKSAANETATALASSSITIDYLVVAGGGGGASSGNFNGGGGAGGLRTSYGSTSGGGASAETSVSLLKGTNYTVTVGSGGSAGSSGSNSVFDTITSIGGGGAVASSSGTSGGSGAGGAEGGGIGGAAVTSPVVHGYAGGNGHSGGDYGGGGGGAFEPGSTDSVHHGGDGLEVNIIGGTGNYYAGGGGGAHRTSLFGNVQNGGDGGGGRGATYQGGQTSQPGTSNTGGGGGGGVTVGLTGSAGGSGVVILRYPNTYTVTIGSGLTGSTSTDGSDKVTTFTEGTGNISFS